MRDGWWWHRDSGGAHTNWSDWSKIFSDGMILSNQVYWQVSITFQAVYGAREAALELTLAALANPSVLNLSFLIRAKSASLRDSRPSRLAISSFAISRCFASAILRSRKASSCSWDETKEVK